MARSRNLKPVFFENEDLSDCAFSTRLCFAGLWTIADRAGRLEDRPKRIKGQLFAFDNVGVEEMLAELARFGFIVRYEVGGQRLIWIPRFSKHQNPHHREADSLLPAHPDDTGGEPEGADQPEASPGQQQHAKATKPRADAASHNANALGQSEASPGLSNHEGDLARGSSRADSLFSDSGSLIPDSGEPEPKASGGKRACPRARPADVDEQTWKDWLQLRKTKRAPVTETVIRGIRGEAHEAGMNLETFLQIWCRRGSQGLEASWLKQADRNSGSRRGAARHQLATKDYTEGTFNG